MLFFFPRIDVNPKTSQFDQPVGIQVRNLGPHCKVTVQGSIRSKWRGEEMVLVSHAHLYTDQHGSLDLNTDPSLSGSYTG